ncbi:MAG: hypothetical protein HQK49_14555 [Oligoflexia bacterium]|nr:hypothetical protein [Oligoflexia bacterium]
MKKSVSTEILMVFFLAVGMLILASCSGSSSPAPASSSTSSGVTDVSQVPGATDPVTSGYADSFRSDAVLKDRIDPVPKLASTGKVLSTVGITDFTSVAQASRTRAGCEAIAMLKTSYENASTPDKIKCYIGTIKSNYATAGLSATSIKEDGTYNYFNIVQNGTTQGQVKFKIVKSGGIVSEFEMFECMGTAPAGHSGNTGYIHVVLSGTTASIDVKNIRGWGSGSNSGTFKNQFSVSGTVVNRVYTAKEMTNIFYQTFSSTGFTGTNYGKVIVNEYLDSFKIRAYMNNSGTGTWSNNGTSNYFANSQGVTVYGLVQLLNTTSGKMSTLAAGDGTLKYTISGKNKSSATTVAVADAEACTTTGSGCWVQSVTSQVDAWNGDNLNKLSDATTGFRYSTVNAASADTTQTSPTITMGDTEAWNCSTIDATAAAAGVTALTTVDMSSLSSQMAVCDTQYGFGSEGGNINCWQMEQRN